jgi:hypothetical protein
LLIVALIITLTVNVPMVAFGCVLAAILSTAAPRRLHNVPV